MTRDWDVIRDVLVQVESIPPDQRYTFHYGTGGPGSENDPVKVAHAVMLHDAGMLRGTLVRPLSDPPQLGLPELTWEGRDLLDTIRSKTLWERIKVTAREKGIELTVDAVKALGRAALGGLVG